MLTIGGLNGAYPPSDEEGFNKHLGELITPALALEISRAKPVTGIRAYRELYNRARHFEKWREDVAGFVALGDSAMVFNPYHGQGMSMAAASANTLGELCATSKTADAYAFTRRFHKKQAKVTRLAWDLATRIDMEWPGTVGKRPLGYDLYFAAGAALIRACHEYPALKRQMGPLYQLTAEPYSLLTPTLVAGVVYAELRRRLGGRRLLPHEHDTSDITPWTTLLSGTSAASPAE